MVNDDLLIDRETNSGCMQPYVADDLRTSRDLEPRILDLGLGSPQKQKKSTIRPPREALLEG